MKLARLRLQNFRCFQDEITFDFDDITALIGRNDIGKSTVMDALDIFLNDGTPDKNDASMAGERQNLKIICEFTDLPSNVVLDEDFKTDFQTEYLLNMEGRLEIHKTYSGNLLTPKCNSTEIFASHPTVENVRDLLQLKNSELKQRANQLNVDLKEVNQAVNAELRKSIRESVGDLKLEPILLPLNDGNAKKAWDGVKSIIPVFALFRTDRASTDQDSEVQDPLKMAVKEAIRQKEVELNALIAHVEAEVKGIAAKTLEKIKEMDPDLAKELNPQIVVKKWDTLFNVSITGDGDIPINKRGSGVRRLILLNFFRAKAEQASVDRNDASVIYAIEEPENSQHPDNQRLLMSALRDLSADDQVIVTTHSPMLSRGLPDTCLRYIHEKPDKSREVLHGGGETNRLLVKSLGVLSDNSIKIFVGLEGANDIEFLKSISEVLQLEGVDVPDLAKMELENELIFVPLGGSSLALWTSRLAALSRPEFHLYDRDNNPPAEPKYQASADALNMRDNCLAVITGKKEMENYIHFEAINEAYLQQTGVALGLTSNFGDFDDVPAQVAELVHAASDSPTVWTDLDDDSRKRKVSRAKKLLNHFAAPLMTTKRINEVDPDGHILQWFQSIKNLIEAK